MQGLWSGLGVAQQATMALTGAGNAIYFARRAALERGVRRLAAVVLVGIFSGIALDGALYLGDDAAGLAWVHRTPLLAASLTTSALLVLGAGR